MMLPLKMKRVAVQVLSDDAPLAALVLAECGAFNPESASVLQEELPEFPASITVICIAARNPTWTESSRIATCR